MEFIQKVWNLSYHGRFLNGRKSYQLKEHFRTHEEYVKRESMWKQRDQGAFAVIKELNCHGGSEDDEEERGARNIFKDKSKWSFDA